jgi:hypothetical protein
MDNFKKLVYSLEKRIEELERQHAAQKHEKTDTIRYVSSTGEFGNVPLDELDTFRFNHRIETRSDTGTYHYYVLRNPSPQLIAYMEDRKEGYNLTVSGVRSRHGPDTVEKDTYTMLDPHGHWIPVPNGLKQILDSKVWEFASHDPAGWTITKNKMGCTLSRDPGVALEPFKRTVRVSFVNNYSTIPQIVWNITPVQNVSEQAFCCKIKDITTHYVEFEIVFGGDSKIVTKRYVEDNRMVIEQETGAYNAPENLVLNWHAYGHKDSEYIPVDPYECEPLLHNTDM